MEENVVLMARGITMTFPGVRALENVDFTLRRGEIHALMGENGAGKSTSTTSRQERSASPGSMAL